MCCRYMVATIAVINVITFKFGKLGKGQRRAEGDSAGQSWGAF